MPANSQKDYRSIVKVGASATAMVEPDTAVFGVRFGRRCKSQEACAEDYAAELAKVKAALDSFGLAEELKTSGYCTYAHRTGKKGVVDGYDYGSWGTLKAERANHDVGAIWQALSENVASASIHLSFEIADERAAEDSLIEEAVSRARNSAETLARAAGMLLGGVREIRYQREGDACDRRMFGEAAPSGPARFDERPDFEPEPIEIECHVDVDWWLAERRD